jgi:hypothetical protein
MRFWGFIAMSFSAKLVAKQVLMCGLRNLPFIGTAVEVVQGVCTRHEQLALDGRVAAIEGQMTRVEKKVRDAVEKEIRAVLANLSHPNLDGASLTNEIGELQGIRAQGWDLTLFDGLLANSSHWDELHRNPQNYGRVLQDIDPVTQDKIHLIIDADRTRLLELPHYAFSSLLAHQAVGAQGRGRLGAGHLGSAHSPRAPSSALRSGVHAVA